MEVEGHEIDRCIDYQPRPTSCSNREDTLVTYDRGGSLRPPQLRVVPQSSTASVKAGEEITRGKYGVGQRQTGTAGLIVRKNGASKGAFVLTCAHVLGTPAVGEDEHVKNDNSVYSPRFTECCGIECNRPFGQVVPGTLNPVDPELLKKSLIQPEKGVVEKQLKIGEETFAVDAALIELASDANAFNEAPPKIGQISGVRDLIQEWSLSSSVQQNLELDQAKQILVKKYGATTKYTEGTVRRLARQYVRERVEGQDTPDESDALVLEIEVNPGQGSFSKEYELDMNKFMARNGIATGQEVAALFNGTKVTATVGGSPETPILKVVANTFSQSGDSGAPIVDKDNRIVGLLRSGTAQPIFVKDHEEPVDICTGSSQAVFIGAALEKLQVAFLPAGQQTAGAPIVVPGMAIERHNREVIDWATLDRARVAVENSTGGAHFAMLAGRHFEEIRQLVHHRRRVTVTWHRHKGPGFVVALLRAAGRPGCPVPGEIDGVKLIDAMRAMRDVLVAEGSPGLRAAIVEHEHKVLVLVRRAVSLDDVLVALVNL